MKLKSEFTDPAEWRAYLDRKNESKRRVIVREPTPFDELMGFGPDEKPYMRNVTKKDPVVDARPFLAWVSRIETEMDLQRTYGPREGKKCMEQKTQGLDAILGEAVGRRIRDMKKTGVGSLAIMDRALCRLGGPALAELYPEH